MAAGQAQYVAPPLAAEKPDTYRERLIKYIPSEVIALHLALSKILMAATVAPHGLYWAIFGVGLLGTVVYQRVVNKVQSWFTLAVSIGAFAVWVFAIGEPFASLSWYQPVYGALLLPIYTFFVAIFEPPSKAAP